MSACAKIRRRERRTPTADEVRRLWITCEPPIRLA
jgi:hypothetical protein